MGDKKKRKDKGQETRPPRGAVKVPPPDKKERRLLDSFRVDKPGAFRLADHPTRVDGGPADKAAARAELAVLTAALDHWQERLYAEGKRSLLVVFQAMDTGGKDGTIRAVFGPLNPQGVTVASFKAPSARELAHDYLWRVHRVAPRRGMIGVFNRSHYEDVLVPLAQKTLPAKEVEKRYGHLNDFERLLADNGATIVKIFLNISKEEQRERLQARLDVARKNWKFEPGDLATRKRWDDYMAAYQAVLRRCAAPHAPWHVIPADVKWFRDWAVARILLAALERMAPEYPAPAEGLAGIEVR